MHLLGEGLFVVGLSIITNVVMEAYHQRKTTEQVGDYDAGWDVR
jgi:hypothetical protein